MSDKTELQSEASATHGLSSTEGAKLERLVMFIPLHDALGQSLRLEQSVGQNKNVWKLYIGENEIRVLDIFENLFINSAINETSRMKT